jgi:glycosyltransferase involved in cell wall biosynthesis
MLSYAFRVIPLGLKLKEKPDVVLASSPHPFAGLAGWILAKLKGAAFIFEVRDLWPQTFVEIGGYSDKSPIVVLLRMLERFLYQRARKIVVLLPRASDYITGLGIPVDKIVYIPNGVRPELFSEAFVELPQEMETFISNMKSRGKLLAGYTGAHGTADGLDTIIEAARQLQDKGADKIHFLLVGEGPEKPRLTAVAHNYKLNNINFFSPIPKKAMPRLLNTLDIAIVILKKSTLWEYGTSKNKLFEYMICALPVIWAINSASDPVAEAGCGITVPPEDPQAMAEAILRICGMSEEERRQMGMRGHEYVLKYHATPVLTGQLLEVMQDVVSK